MLVILLATFVLVSGQDTSELDCLETEGAIYQNGACECEQPDHVISSDRTSCLPIVYGGYGAECSDHAQCVARMETGARCLDGACVCADNFHYLLGRCWKISGYGDSCQRKESCYANSDSDTLTCDEGKCTCGNNTYSPRDGMCRRQAQVGEPCDFDLDCRTENATCDSTTYVCVAPEQSISPDEYSDELEFEDIFGDCSGPHMDLTDGGQCVCSRGYYQIDNQQTNTSECVPELGNACTNDSECSHMSSSICRRSGSNGGKICGCKGGWGPDISGKKCQKSRKFAMNCNEDVQCSYYGGVCNQGTKKTCICPEGMSYTGTLCWVTVELGSSCQDPRDCSVPGGVGVECRDGTCSCVDGYGNTTTKDCWKLPQALGDRCEENIPCNMDNAVCTENQCQCKQGYQVPGSESCVVGPGGPCSSDKDCAAVSSFQCRNNICACPQGYVQGEKDTTLCFPEAKQYGDNCTETVQCSILLGDNGTCDPEQSTCMCSKGFHLHEQQCWMTRELGQSCDRGGQCYAEKNSDRLECRDSFCKCKFDFHEDLATMTCSSSRMVLSLLTLVVWSLLVRLR